jgi:putative drug exporter of the RND superfamily
MKLLGDWNWYMPKWLEWLPKGPALDAEGLPLAPEPAPARNAPGPPEPRPAEA